MAQYVPIGRVRRVYGCQGSSTIRYFVRGTARHINHITAVRIKFIYCFFTYLFMDEFVIDIS